MNDPPFLGLSGGMPFPGNLRYIIHFQPRKLENTVESDNGGRIAGDSLENVLGISSRDCSLYSYRHKT